MKKSPTIVSAIVYSIKVCVMLRELVGNPKIILLAEKYLKQGLESRLKAHPGNLNHMDIANSKGNLGPLLLSLAQ